MNQCPPQSSHDVIAATCSYPKTVKLAVRLPAPLVLSDYEPFDCIDRGQFGLTYVHDLNAETYAALRGSIEKAISAGATVGYNPVEQVRAVFFDMDATVVAQESIVELAAHANRSAEVAAITERAMAGEIEFAVALRERVALLAGLPISVLDATLAGLTVNPGIQAFVSFCRQIEVPTFLVSGGFVPLAEPLGRRLGFDAVLANRLEVAGRILTGRIDGDIIDAAAKRNFLIKKCFELGIDASKVAAVGDGANDIPMMQAAGVAIGFKPKAAVLPHVQAVNAIGDHAFLGPLLFGREVAATVQ